jgi:hypothetical protein
MGKKISYRGKRNGKLLIRKHEGAFPIFKLIGKILLPIKRSVFELFKECPIFHSEVNLLS